MPKTSESASRGGCGKPGHVGAGSGTCESCVAEAYTRGFVEGQSDTYCEQVLNGAKFAAQLGCARDFLPDVERVVAQRGCVSLVEEREFGRVGVWIFRNDFARQLFEEYRAGSVLPKAAATWFMGKIFGYADSDVITYIEEHDILK